VSAAKPCHPSRNKGSFRSAEGLSAAAVFAAERTKAAVCGAKRVPPSAQDLSGLGGLLLKSVFIRVHLRRNPPQIALI
jgi:hypothetical protein